MPFENEFLDLIPQIMSNRSTFFTEKGLSLQAALSLQSPANEKGYMLPEKFRPLLFLRKLGNLCAD